MVILKIERNNETDFLVGGLNFTNKIVIEEWNWRLQIDARSMLRSKLCIERGKRVSSEFKMTVSLNIDFLKFHSTNRNVHLVGKIYFRLQNFSEISHRFHQIPNHKNQRLRSDLHVFRIFVRIHLLNIFSVKSHWNKWSQLHGKWRSRTVWKGRTHIFYIRTRFSRQYSSLFGRATAIATCYWHYSR